MTSSLPGTFGALVRNNSVSYPHRVAVVDGGVSLTWPALADRVDRLAGALQQAGVNRGDRILWLGQNSFRVYELLCAAAKLGAMMCPANWRWSAAEMEFVIDDFDPRVIFWQHEEIGDASDGSHALTMTAYGSVTTMPPMPQDMRVSWPRASLRQRCPRCLQKRHCW